MFTKSNRKGFTVVELVIVIAIIAILATALIPTFGGLIEKASLTKDQQAVRNMNTDLVLATVEGKIDTAGDAINALAASGWYGDKLDTYTADYHYAYHLESNTMYLLNKAGEIVYPENDRLDAASLWGWYKGRPTDKITNVSKYVALAPIHNDTSFQGVFNSGSYEIDLNKNIITATAPEGVTITVKNGFSTVSDYASNESGVTKLTELASDNLPETVDGVTTYENMYIPQSQTLKGLTFVRDLTGEIVFSNCVIDAKDYSPITYKDAVTSITVENCTFLSSGTTEQVVLGFDNYTNDKTLKTTIIVRNNEFIGVGRAIALKGCHSDVITIENNTFNLASVEGGCAIQLERITNSTVTVKDNTVISGNSFVRIRQVAINDSTLAQDVAKYTFTNNTIADTVGNMVIGDDGCEALVAEFKKIVK